MHESTYTTHLPARPKLRAANCHDAALNVYVKLIGLVMDFSVVIQFNLIAQMKSQPAAQLGRRYSAQIIFKNARRMYSILL